MKVTPRLRRRRNYVDFATLDEGEMYIKDEQLFIKVGRENEQFGFSLDGKDYHDDADGVEVIPVDGEVTWSYKKPAKAKK
jgi:hypothetical protein